MGSKEGWYGHCGSRERLSLLSCRKFHREQLVVGRDKVPRQREHTHVWRILRLVGDFWKVLPLLQSKAKVILRFFNTGKRECFEPAFGWIRGTCDIMDV